MKQLNRHIVIFFSLILIGSVAVAQSTGSVELRLFPDQQVYMVGEDIWIQGDVMGGLVNDQTSAANTQIGSGNNQANHFIHAKMVTVQLLDRKGVAKSSVDLLLDGRKFSGYINLPYELGSDYYFLDAHIKGVISRDQIVPVMIMNALMPPAYCDMTASLGSPISDKSLDLQINKSDYKSREKVEVNFKGMNETASYILNVSRQDGLSIYMDSVSSGFQKTILHDALGNIEDEGHVIIAKVISGGAPVSGLRVLATIRGEQSNVATGKTDTQGMVKFILPFTFSSNELILSPAVAKGQQVIVDIIKDEVLTYDIAFPCLKLRENLKADIEERIFNANVRNRFYVGNKRTGTLTIRDSTNFYGKPDFRYYLDDYVRFPVLEEVFTEYIIQLKVKKEKDQVGLRVLDIPRKTFFEKEPLVLVDGTPIRNIRELLDSDPLRIKYIDILTKKYILGDEDYGGVIHFRTYRSDRAGIPMGSSDLSAAFSGIEEPSKVNIPDHQKGIGRMPDWRNLLYNDPKISVGKASFFTSDANGTYKITVRGIADNGTISSGSTVISVKD